MRRNGVLMSDPHEKWREVYRLAPQMRDIVEFLKPEKTRWLLYTMFFNPKNFRSPTINTDDLGFRISRANGRVMRVSDTYEIGVPVNLIVGSSAALGVGATADEFTLSSNLARVRDETWLNFTGFAYNAMQEVILFLLHSRRFSDIRNVVLVSGVNTLALEGLPEQFRTDHGRCYYSHEYKEYMSRYNEEHSSRHLPVMQIARRRWRKFWTRDDESMTTAAGIDTAAAIQSASEAIADALEHWVSLLRPHGARLSYFLQPVSAWAKESLEPEEVEVLNAFSRGSTDSIDFYGNLLGSQVHESFVDALSARCRRIGVPFYDLSVLIRCHAMGRANIFVDHVHFNDTGYAGAASIINDHIDHS